MPIFSSCVCHSQTCTSLKIIPDLFDNWQKYMQLTAEQAWFIWVILFVSACLPQPCSTAISPGEQGQQMPSCYSPHFALWSAGTRGMCCWGLYWGWLDGNVIPETWHAPSAVPASPAMLKWWNTCRALTLQPCLLAKMIDFGISLSE